MDQMKKDWGDEINIFDYLKAIFRYKKFIIWTVSIMVVLTAVYSLIITPTYEAKAVIAPVQQTSAQSSVGAVAAQFGMFGVAVPQSANASEMINLLKSDILMQKIVERYDLYSVLFKKDVFKGKSENQKAWAGIRKLKEILEVKEDKKAQTIVVTAQYKDPVITEKIVNYALKELTEFMSAEAKRVAKANRKHLEEQIESTTDPFIRQKIYALIAQQIENAMMAEVKENFTFKMIDPPRVPDKRIKPKRRQMVVIAFFVSLLLGIFLVFAKKYFQKNWEVLEELAKMSGLKKFPWKIFRGKENNI